MNETDIYTFQITPSEYAREMKMTTHQRLQNLNSIVIDNMITDKTPKKISKTLSFTPRILVFQNFKQSDVIVAKFSVKNVSKVQYQY